MENFLQDGCYDVKAVKVKLVKVMFSGLKNEFDHFDLDRNEREFIGTLALKNMYFIRRLLKFSV